jgi:hypothetical protein
MISDLVGKYVLATSTFRPFRNVSLKCAASPRGWQDTVHYGLVVELN